MKELRWIDFLMSFFKWDLTTLEDTELAFSVLVKFQKNGKCKMTNRFILIRGCWVLLSVYFLDPILLNASLLLSPQYSQNWKKTFKMSLHIDCY